MKKNVCYLMIICLVSASSLRAGIVANWDFEEGIDGQYGVEAITQTVDFVSGLIAYPASGDPLYVRGADGVGHATGSGILKVASNDALLTGFSEFNISFDARLLAVPTATQALLRYGVTTTAWNIYTTTDSSIRIEVYDAGGTRYTAQTASSTMFPGDGLYHHYEFVWDGADISILIDGASQVTTAWALSEIRSTGGLGRLGIGGIVREAETTSQEFNGFIDNVIISNTAVVPEPASLALVLFGGFGIILRRWRRSH